MTFIKEINAMKQIALLLPLIVSCVCCGKHKIAKGTPDCVKDKIQAFDKESTCDKDVSVMEYTFQEENVYVFNPGSCGADMTSEVMDSECHTEGYLGGIAGNTQINGEDFSTATYIRTVWQK
ncbi:MAG: DUF6970 domain-containing protein [Bacteroidota bacterium]